MTGPRRPSAAEVAVALLAASASFFTLLSWDGLSDRASAFLVPLFWIALACAVLGLGLRATGLPRAAVPLLQLAVLALLLHRAWTDSWLPSSESLAMVQNLFRRAGEEVAQFAAPVPAEATAFPSLMVAVGAGVVLLVDLIATTLRRAPLVGLPLLAVFTAPVSLLGGVPWPVFAVAAGSYVLLIAAEQADRLGGWGVSLAGSDSAAFPRDSPPDSPPDSPRTAPGGRVQDSQPHRVRLSTLWPTASRIGLAGVGAALVVPVLLPIGDGLLGGDGPGVGGGDGGVALDNPMVDMRRDLVRGDDVPLVFATTDDPDPTYLRLAVLDEYDGQRWRPSDRSIPTSNRARGEIPGPPGLDDSTPRTRHAWELRVTGQFDSQWLPVPSPVVSVDAPGDWRYDLDTVDFVSADESMGTAGITYRAVGLDPHPTAQALVDAPPGPQGLVLTNTRLPSSVPSWVADLAASVTEGATGQFDRAVRLQQWFRTDGGFTYSLRTQAGSDVDDLAAFLGTGEGSREGYCEQFAASMALLSRALRIPARVAVGFLAPSPVPGGDDDYVYSAHDLHAWPELYFENAGWVRFEPTPQLRGTTAPAYTTGGVPQADDAPVPSASPSSETARPAPDQETQDTGADEAESRALERWLPWLGGLAVLLTVLTLPRVTRAWLRRRRLAPADPDRLVEGAWAEVRATALDLGLGWDDRATLRTRARALVPALRGDQDAVRALERLVLLLERSRYARTGLGSSVERAEVESLCRTVTDRLRATEAGATRRRSTWLPASLWRSGRTRATATSSAPPLLTGAEEESSSREDQVSV